MIFLMELVYKTKGQQREPIHLVFEEEEQEKSGL
jgi:hypothetical protein